jgi:hypothetical protein
MTEPSPFWKSLEELPGLSAVPAIWRKRLGPDFDTFGSAFLVPKTNTVASFPCPHECGCWHRVPRLTPTHAPLRETAGSVITVTCQCSPPVCPPLNLTLADITPLQVNRPKLARSICSAFGCERKDADLGLPNTAQIGSWSADSVPVILSIQFTRAAFRSDLAQLAAQLRKPFILLAPTNRYFDATCLAILETHRAGFFPLDANLTLTGHGTFQPTRTPGELFSPFTPQPKEIDIDVARAAITLIDQLESETKLPPPTVMAVFRLYCRQNLSADEVARKCSCSKATVINRLALICKRIGQHPKNLRALSAHFTKIESQLSDPRAKHVHRKASTVTEQDDSD